MVFTPLDPTKAEVHVTGEAPNQGLEFYIPRGAKGEPGGFTAGVDLALGNLNEILTPGLYRQPDGNRATAGNNYPTPAGGSLEVLLVGSPNSVMQRYTPHSGHANGVGRTMFLRRYTGAAWDSWRTYASQRVDQSAGRAIYTWDDVNGRDQLVYGDTGWRDISASLEPDFVLQASAPRFMIRRLGYAVTLSIRVGPAASLAGVNRSVGKKMLAAFPAGFLPAANNSYVVLGTGCVNIPSTSIAQIANLSTSNELWLYGATGVWGNATSDAIQVVGGWITDQVWPATLPGTAVGSIPNL